MKEDTKHQEPAKQEEKDTTYRETKITEKTTTNEVLKLSGMEDARTPISALTEGK